MQAVVIHRYGGNDTVEVLDIPQPSGRNGIVLIRVRAASVNPVDWKVRSGEARILSGSRFPKVLGNEFSGEVAGGGGTRFRQGDRVIGWPGVRVLGAFADYAAVPEASVFPLAEDISFAQAACLPIAGLTALQALRNYGKVDWGKKVLVNGAAGGVGHFAVQIAKIFGAEVTAVCSGANTLFVKALGADHVVDHQEEDFTRQGRQYDIIFDAVAKRSFPECRPALARHGVYISTLPSVPVLVNQYLTGRFTSRRAASLWVKQRNDDLQWMMRQIRAARVRVVIDRTYPLAQAREALAYSEAGKARGKVLLETAI